MTLDNLLRWGTEALIVILAALTTAQLIRQRDRSRARYRAGVRIARDRPAAGEHPGGGRARELGQADRAESPPGALVSAPAAGSGFPCRVGGDPGCRSVRNGVVARDDLVLVRCAGAAGARPGRLFLLARRICHVQQANADLTHEVQNRKKAEEDLAASNRELEAFSYSVSHDLRAPLRHIAGFAELLQRWPGPATLDDKAKRHLNVIVESVARMGTLIDDLLAFSRAGRVEMHTARVPLDQLIQDVRAEVTVDRRNGQTNWNIHPLPDVQGDPGMLRVAFVNLLSNAVKYTRTRPRPEIEIGCIEHPDETVIFVRDNGVGFDMSYVDKLFGVFQRLHRPTNSRGQGSGWPT